MGFLDNLVNMGQAVAAQINPFDNGRTYNSVRQQGANFTPRAPAPVYQQATHNGLTNFVGGSMVKPLIQFPLDAGIQLYNHGVAPAFNLPQQQLQNNPLLQYSAKFAGANGSMRQTIGSGIQTGLTLAGGPLTSLAERGVGTTAAALMPRATSAALGAARLGLPEAAAGRALPTVIKYGTGALAGSAGGAGFNAAAAYGAGANAKQTWKAAGQGSLFGLGLGVGAPLAADALGAGAKLVHDNTRPLSNQHGFLGGPNATGYKAAQAAGKVFPGVDGQPRFEGDDSGAKWKDFYKTVNNSAPQKLGDVLDHPALFQQYPDLKDVTVKFNKGAESDGTKGQSGKNSIMLHTASFSGTGGQIADDMKGTLLHEVQHVIQEKEGFATGGSPDLIRQSAVAEARKNMEALRAPMNKAGFDTPEYKTLQAQYRKNAQVLHQALFNPEDFHSQYKKLAGEAEARAVQARMNMPDSQRYVKGQQYYHGTSTDAANAIRKEGFKDHTGKNLSPAFGNGTYLVNRRTGAMSYADFRRKNVISAYLPDNLKLYKAKDSEAYTLDTKKLKQQGYDGVEIPYSATEKNVTIFNPDKIKVGKAPAKSTFYNSLDVPKDQLIVQHDGGKAAARVNPEAPKPDIQPILAHMKQFPNGVDVNAVREAFKNDPEALLKLEQTQHEILAKKAADVTKATQEKVAAAEANARASGTKTPLGKPQQYRTIHQGGQIKAVEGQPVKIVDGVDTFVHKGDNGYIVSEASTGQFLATSTSPEGAIAKAKFSINNVGLSKFKQLIAEKQLPAEQLATKAPAAPKTAATPEIDLSGPDKFDDPNTYYKANETEAEFQARRKAAQAGPNGYLYGTDKEVKAAQANAKSANPELAKLQAQLPKGYTAQADGSVLDPKGQEMTMGAVQDLVQPKYITEFEHATKTGDHATMQRIAAEHPNDNRVHIGVTDTKPSADVNALNTQRNSILEARRTLDQKLSTEYDAKAKNLSPADAEKLKAQYQTRFSKEAPSTDALDKQIKDFQMNEVADKKTQTTVTRLVNESHSQNTYDPKSTGYFIDLSPKNIKDVTPLKGINDYPKQSGEHNIYVDTKSGITSVRVEPWNDGEWRVSNGNGNEIARLPSEQAAVDFGKKALTIENEAARQGKRVILSGSKFDNTVAATNSVGAYGGKASAETVTNQIGKLERAMQNTANRIKTAKSDGERQRQEELLANLKETHKTLTEQAQPEPPKTVSEKGKNVPTTGTAATYTRVPHSDGTVDYVPKSAAPKKTLATDPLASLKQEALKQGEWKNNAQQIHGERTAQDLASTGVTPDKNGLITLYRGSQEKPGVVRSGSYLTNSPEVAKQYGKVETIRVKPDELVSNGVFNNTTGKGLSLSNVLELKKQSDGSYRSVHDLYNQAHAEAAPKKTLATDESGSIQVTEPPKPTKPQLPPTDKVPGGKERGLTRNMKKSENFSPELRAQISSSYKPFTDDAATAETSHFMKQSLSNAYNHAMASLAGDLQRVSSLKGRMAGENKQLVSNAGAVIQALDATKGKGTEAQAVHDLLGKYLTEAGQTSQAAKLIYNRTPQGMHNMALRDLRNAGVPITEELKQELATAKAKIQAADKATGTKPGTSADQMPRESFLARARYSKLVGSKIPTDNGKKAVAIWKTNILSSPKTAVKVGIVQPVGATGEQISSAVATPFDMLTSLATGQRKVTGPGLRSTAYGAKYAIQHGIPDAKTRFAENIVMPHSTGFGSEELGANGFKAEGANFGVGKNGQRTMLDKATGGISSKFLNGYTTAVGRVHGALQVPWYEFRYAQHLMQSAQLDAKNRGLSGDAADQHVQQYLAKPPKAAQDSADLAAQYSTSQQPTALGQAAHGLQQTLPGGQIIAPITRVPGAVATQLVNYSPAGFVKTGGKALIDASKGRPFDQEAFSMGLGRAVTGSAAVGGGVALATQGRVSGAYPKDRATQALWQSANIPANGLYVGGHAFPGSPWKNYGGTWEQVGSPGGAIAQTALAGGAIADGYKKGGLPNAALQGFAGGAQIATDQPYLTGISGAMTAIKTPNQAKSFLDQTAGSVVPNIVRDLASATDQQQRQTSVQSPITSMKNSITNGIPRLREHNLPQVDTFGNTVPRNNISSNNAVNILNSAFNPYNPQKSNPSAITNALGDIHNTLDQNGKPLTIPTQINKKYNITQNGKTVPLTDAQRTQFIQQSGQATQAEMPKLMASPQWQQATPAQRSAMISGTNGIMTGQRDLAKQQFGSTTKIGTAGTAAKNGQLPMLSTNGKITNSIQNGLSLNLSGDDKNILMQYKSLSAPQRTKLFSSQNNAQYLYNKASYDNKVANNQLSTAQKISGAQALKRDSVGANYSQNVRQIFGLSKPEIYNYLNTLPSDQANNLYQQLNKYGSDLVANGLEKSNKVASLTSSGSGSRGSSKSTGSTKLAAFQKKEISTTTSLAKRAAGAKVRKATLSTRFKSSGTKMSNKSYAVKSVKATAKGTRPKPILTTAVSRASGANKSKALMKGVLA